MTEPRGFFNAPTDLVIPKTLVHRDPRNRQHIGFALALLGKLGTLTITERTKRELTSLGIAPSKQFQITEGISDSDIIAAFFLPESGLQFPDNQITTCHDCKAALQLRPETATAKGVKLCYFCAVDRLLAEYWKTH